MKKLALLVTFPVRQGRTGLIGGRRRRQSWRHRLGDLQRLFCGFKRLCWV